MGCSSSVTFKDDGKATLKRFVNSGKFKAYVRMVSVSGQTRFTREEVELLKNTWPCLMKELQVNGLQVFLRIFELCPAIKVLFHVENVRLSQLARDATLKEHGGRFMNMIGNAVNVLDGDNAMEKLEEIFHTLGKKHQRFEGFQSEYFEVFYDAIIWQLERSMGTEFTTEVSNVWSRLIVFIIKNLKLGYMSKSSTSTDKENT